MDTMSIDDLGKLIRAAYGLDTSWRRAAACRRWEPDEVTPELEAWRRWDYEGPSIWQVDNDQIMNGIRGAKLIEIALMVCHACPAQYDCATWAVKAKVQAGTYGMKIPALLWLQTQDEPLDLIEMARAGRLAVADVIDGARFRPTAST